MPVVESTSSESTTFAANTAPVPAPANIVEGNVLLLQFCAANRILSGYPEGWIEILSDATSPDQYFTWIAYKEATASEPATYDFTMLTATGSYCASINNISGVGNVADIVAVLDLQSIGNAPTPAGDIRSPAITPQGESPLFIRGFHGINFITGVIQPGAEVLLVENYTGMMVSAFSDTESTQKTFSYEPTWTSNGNSVTISVPEAVGSGPPVIEDLSPVSSSARGATTIDVTLSTYNVGDLLMFHVYYRWDGLEPIAQPVAGWNQETIFSDNPSTYVSTYWKVADGTEGSSVTVTFLNGPRGGLARCRTITGFNMITAFSHEQPAAGNQIEIAPASPVGANSLAISAAILAGGSSVQAPTWPAGWTDDYYDTSPGTVRSDCVGGHQQVDSDVAAGQWITNLINNNPFAATTMIIAPAAPPTAQPRVIPVLRGTGAMGRGQ